MGFVGNAMVRYANDHPFLGGLLFLLVGGVFFYFLTSLSEPYEQFIEGQVVDARVSESYADRDSGNYVIKYTWLGSDGKFRYETLKTQAGFANFYKKGEKIDIIISSNNPDNTMVKEDLESRHIFYILGRPATNIVYVTLIFFLFGAYFLFRGVVEKAQQ